MNKTGQTFKINSIEEFDSELTEILDDYVNSVIEAAKIMKLKVFELMNKKENSNLPEHLVIASVMHIQKKLLEAEKKITKVMAS